MIGHPQTEETRRKISRTLRGHKRSGRPTVDTAEIRRRIEEAAALDASVAEIALYAGIHRDTLHEILKKDEAFSDRIDALRDHPVLKARQVVITKMGETYQNAMDYLKRKRKLEFGDSSNIDVNNPAQAEEMKKQTELLRQLAGRK